MCWCTVADLKSLIFFFFFQAEDGIRDGHVTGVQRVLFRSACFEIYCDRSRSQPVTPLTSISGAVEPSRQVEIVLEIIAGRRVIGMIDEQGNVLFVLRSV